MSCEHCKTITDKTIIEWEKEFDKFVLNPKHWSDEIPSHLYLADIESFIRKQLILAEKRGEEKGSAHKGEAKRKAYQQGFKEGEEKVANDICKLIDNIELNYHGSSLEQWKAFKHIRNAIREKYVLKQSQNKEEGGEI